MKWFKIRIGTTRDNEDAVSSAMYRGGFGGAVIEDHAGLTENEKKRMFVDILPEQQEDDGQAFLDFYAQVRDDGLMDPAGTVYDDMAGTSSAVNIDRDRKPVLYTEEKLVSRVREILEDAPGLSGYTLETETIEDENWAESWKEHFHSFTVGRITICPPWEAEENESPDEDGVLPSGETAAPGGASRSGETAVPGGASRSGENAGETGDIRKCAGGEADGSCIRVIIDPGDAFGTGTHETTMLCLEALQERFSGETGTSGENGAFSGSGAIEGNGSSGESGASDLSGDNATPKSSDLSGVSGIRILDAGTGSGILAISALMLGARYAAGTDVDPCAVRAAGENAALNGINEERFYLRKGDLTKDRKLVAELTKDGKFDVITVNIIAEIIEPMVPVLSGMFREGGTLIASG
ncbi:MAG: 50S ribosomal protein L11 methyltransferase, partial [Lachnospiraceae bacterium]|nr:50S ribosomal protein L11 methyltransferase [Lachnospiraceae bacterium]